MQWTGRQIHEHVALIVGKSVAEYHKHYHTPRWKKFTMRVAAEVQSFRLAVNESHGKSHERGELGWQRVATWIARFLDRLPFAGKAALTAGDEETDGSEQDSPDEGQPTAFKVSEGRSAHRRDGKA